MEISLHTEADLRAYLARRRNLRSQGVNSDFEDFLKNFASLFALRTSAEEYWGGSPRGSSFGHKEHKYQADSIRGALPLEWDAINGVLLPEKNRPPATLITYVATHCVEDVRVIASGMRRILSRERVSTPVGKVQQLDNYCMRWLMRQPGRGFAEKAGTRQRIMAVVRREQFDTLENRVFKDFLIRAENLADGYLDEFSKYKDDQTYKAVRSFKIACQGALMIPVMDQISGLTSLPQPNYVLQQDNRYSKIWTTYCKIVKFANLAEKWWGRKDELEHRLERLKEECKWQCEHRDRTRFFSRIWFEELDAVPNFMENAHTHHAEVTEEEFSSRERESRLVSPEGGVAVVDLSGSHAYGNALIKGGFHPNARSRIYSQQFPLLDDELALREKSAERIELSRIFPVINDEKLQDGRGSDYELAVANAAEYCARLYGELHNVDRTLDELVVLSPDDWNAVTQETVIRSFSAIDRKKVHLLWRSVATVLGLNDDISCQIKDGENVAVVDFRNDGSVLVTALKYLKDDEAGRLIPQRSVCRKNGGLNCSRYYISTADESAEIVDSSPVRESRVLCLSGNVPTSFKRYLERFCAYTVDKTSAAVICGRAERGRSSWVVLEDADGSWAQREGAFRFVREHGLRTLYFDELEPMWVVGQDEIHEKIVCEALVEAEERFPGGKSKQVSVPRGRMNIGEGQRGVEFLFHIGAINNQTPLHRYKQKLTCDFVREQIPLDVKIDVSPGQGMALTTIMASIFKEPIHLDYLKNMELSEETIAKKDDEIERGFPPTSAVVEAIQDDNPITSYRQIKAFLDGRVRFSELPATTCLFYSARRKTVRDLRDGESRLHLLDRYNVFGNVPSAMRPRWMTEEQESELFRKVVAGLRTDRSKALRLIAWTYRGSNEDIASVARRIFDRWAKGYSPSVPGEMKLWKSLLGNLLSCKELKDLLPAFIQRFIRIGQLSGWDYDELRMFYYLMQFNEDFCFDAGLDCKNANMIVQMLGDCLRRFRRGQNANAYDAALRSLLYLLRMREKERHFLRDYVRFKGAVPETAAVRESMERTFHAIDLELKTTMANERPATKTLREITLKFLNGSGTLPDVISIA